MLRAAFRTRGVLQGLLHRAIVPIALGAMANSLMVGVGSAQDPRPPSPPQAGANSATLALESGPKRADDSKPLSTPTLPLEPGPAVLPGTKEAGLEPAPPDLGGEEAVAAEPLDAEGPGFFGTAGAVSAQYRTAPNQPDNLVSIFGEPAPSSVVGEFSRRSARLERKSADQSTGSSNDAPGRNPKDIASRLARATTLVWDHHYQDALKKLDQIIQETPDLPAALALRARSRAMRAQVGDKAALDAALADLKRAPKDETFELSVRFTRGIVAAKMAKYDEAIRDFSYAIEKQFDVTRALSYRGYALMQARQVERALADFDQVVERTGDKLEPWLLIDRGWCRATLRQFDGAISDLTRALELSSDKAEVLQTRANTYRAKGDLEHALADLDQITQLKPKDPLAYIERTILLIKMEKYERARNEASRIVELWPEECVAYDFRALVTCLTSDNWTRALPDLDRAIQLEPRYFVSYGLRACLDVANKKYARALGDVALCALTLNECEFRFTWKIDLVEERFFAGAAWRLRENTRKPESPMLASESERRSIEHGVERLLAEALEF